jgi:hypothetical protein
MVMPLPTAVIVQSRASLQQVAVEVVVLIQAQHLAQVVTVVRAAVAHNLQTREQITQAEQVFQVKVTQAEQTLEIAPMVVQVLMVAVQAQSVQMAERVPTGRQHQCQQTVRQTVFQVHPLLIPREVEQLQHGRQIKLVQLVSLTAAMVAMLESAQANHKMVMLEL